MNELDNIKYYFYSFNYNTNSYSNCKDLRYLNDFNFVKFNYPIKIVAKAGMKTLAEWEIDKIHRDGLLKKYNIDYLTCDFKSELSVLIEENYKNFEQYYSEEEKKILRNLLSKYFNFSDDKLNDIFGYNDKITEMVKNMETIQATEFKLFEVRHLEMGYIFEKCYKSDKKIIDYDKLIKETYYSSIINGRAGEVDIWRDYDQDDFYSHYYSIDKLYGFNREDLYKYNAFFYSPKTEELKDKEYIIFLIVDRAPRLIDNILYFALIEYPKDSKLTLIETIENYIYNTFYTVSETTQRRFITFLQRYCSDNTKQFVKTKYNDLKNKKIGAIQ